LLGAKKISKLPILWLDSRI